MGKITYIYGPMRSGKTELLIEKIQYFKNTNCEVIILKPSADTRDSGYITSRAKGIQVKAHPLDNEKDLINLIDIISMTSRNREINIFVDEIHFLDIKILKNLMTGYYKVNSERKNINLYLCGLQYSFLHEEFDSHFEADNVAITAIEVCGTCEECNSERSKYNCLFINGKMVTEGDVYNPGDSEYKVLCVTCRDYILGIQLGDKMNTKKST